MFLRPDNHKHPDWILLVCTCFCVAGYGVTRKYDMQELCAMQQGSARISLEQGNYVQLDLELPLDGATDDNGGGVRCEMVVQTTHKDDGLLFYFENFDFVGSNFATVYRRAPPVQPWCGATLMRVWDGEFHYLDSCVGPGLRRAPPVTTYSSLGAVRLQLLPASSVGGAIGASGVAGGDSKHDVGPIKFTIIATASQKVSVTDDCPSGCCRLPYTFRCPLLDYCIDRKLTCNNVTNCGPRVGYPQDENGELCAERNHVGSGGVLRVVGPSDVQRVISIEESTMEASAEQHTNMLRPLWSTGDADTPGTFGSEAGGPDAPQAFYTRIELVCGIVSIALFCLAGIGVLVCRFRGLPRRSALGRSHRSHGDSISSNHSNNDVDSAEEGVAPAARRPSQVAHEALTLAATPPPLYATVVGSSREPTAGPNAGVRESCAVPKPACRTVPVGPHSNYAAIYTIQVDQPAGAGGAAVQEVNEVPPPPYETLYPKID